MTEPRTLHYSTTASECGVKLDLVVGDQSFSVTLPAAGMRNLGVDLIGAAHDADRFGAAVAGPEANDEIH